MMNKEQQEYILQDTSNAFMNVFIKPNDNTNDQPSSLMDEQERELKMKRNDISKNETK